MARTMAQRLAARMYYYCAVADAGYSQPNRRRIYDLWGRTDPGAVAEGDCSMAALAAAQEAGLPTGAASYTGDMRAALEAEGWQVLPYALCGGDPDNLYTGDFLLKTGHVAVYLGENRLGEFWIDGQGDIGGAAWGDGEGDDTGGESRVVSFTGHPYTQGAAWEYIIRPPDDPEDSSASDSTPAAPSGAAASTPNTQEMSDMFFIKYVTAWGSYAYVMITSAAGAYALDNVEAQVYNPISGYVEVPEHHAQMMIEQAWQRFNRVAAAAAEATRVDIKAATKEILDAAAAAAAAAGTPKPEGE